MKLRIFIAMFAIMGVWSALCAGEPVFEKPLPDGRLIRVVDCVIANPPLPSEPPEVPPKFNVQPRHIDRATNHVFTIIGPGEICRDALILTEYWSTQEPEPPWRQPFGVFDVAVEGERMVVLYQLRGLAHGDVISLAPGDLNRSLMSSPTFLARHFHATGQFVFKGTIEGSFAGGDLRATFERGLGRRAETSHEFRLEPAENGFKWTPDFEQAERSLTRPASKIRAATRPSTRRVAEP